MRLRRSKCGLERGLVSYQMFMAFVGGANEMQEVAVEDSTGCARTSAPAVRDILFGV